MSAQNKIQIDHNVKVSANDQLVWGNREKYPEIEGICVAAHCKQIGRII